MFNAKYDALSAQLARRVPLTPHNLRAAGCGVLEPRVLTADVQNRLAVYNAVRRQAVIARCTVINEQPGELRGIEVVPDAAGRAFVAAGGCTRRVLPGGAVVSRLIGTVNVMYVES